ncbi:MAG TPA: PDZ domain-containing protein, partial [Fimbriimonadaceae bacterium]|nr:PDZ domain-containing protein [Fimbriimonadaceae bacterium]
FYDPNTHGVNWKSVRAKYETRLPMVATRNDLTQVLGDMIAELNTGHCYVGGPSAFRQSGAQPGMLGADFEWDAGANAYRITKILRGETWSPEERSPLAEPGLGVHEGDYLFKVRGKDVSRNVDPAALLIGTAGQQITLTVNSKPTAAGARNVTVVPISNESYMRQQEWINGRRAYVNRVSGGQIGYVYVGDMSRDGAYQFATAYYPNTLKPALIIDVRGNGGGNISGNLLGDLSSKITGYFTFRAGGRYWRERWAPMGQVVALTNEFAFSDGEYFSEFFKRLKIGPLVGHRTGGGEVGSGGGYRMTDGGAVFIPNYGAWVPGEWIIEGRGAVPDVEIDQDPAAVMAGKDPQLDKAIEIILDNLKKHPFVKPEHPPFPVKLGGSRGS